MHLRLGMSNGTATLENSWAVEEINRAATSTPRSCTPGHFSERNENLCSHVNLYVVAYSSFIYNGQNLGITQMSFNMGMVQHCVWSYWETTYSPLKGKELLTDTCNGLDESPENWTEWTQNNAQMLHTVYFYLHNILEMTRCRNGEQLSGCWWFRRGRWGMKGQHGGSP